MIVIAQISSDRGDYLESRRKSYLLFKPSVLVMKLSDSLQDRTAGRIGLESQQIGYLRRGNVLTRSNYFASSLKFGERSVSGRNTRATQTGANSTSISDALQNASDCPETAVGFSYLVCSLVFVDRGNEVEVIRFAEVSLCVGLCFISSVTRRKRDVFFFPVPFPHAMMLQEACLLMAVKCVFNGIGKRDPSWLLIKSMMKCPTITRANHNQQALYAGQSSV